MLYIYLYFLYVIFIYYLALVIALLTVIFTLLQVAAKAWNDYRERNDSIIADLF